MALRSMCELKCEPCLKSPRYFLLRELQLFRKLSRTCSHDSSAGSMPGRKDRKSAFSSFAFGG
ncbi:unnamed protein product [Ixodes pacificus]